MVRPTFFITLGPEGSAVVLDLSEVAMYSDHNREVVLRSGWPLSLGSFPDGAELYKAFKRAFSTYCTQHDLD